ncbi:hypothetical protein [Tenacibaculum sp. 190524A05c]|uniref:hypothetical protein n=1 Tax=Tenacibaculum platacis TaxID=3137852 RepID=UPI0031FB9204
MKKTLLILFSVLTISNVFSQDVDDKFRVHSLSLGIGAPRSSKISLGLGANMDLAFSKGKHLFKFMAGGASELSFNLFGNKNIRDSFEEYSIMYGRAFEVKKWLSFDFFGGIGYANIKYNLDTSNGFDDEFKSIKTVGFPLQLRIRFITSRLFSIGMEQNVNVNSISTLSRTGGFIQFSF